MKNIFSNIKESFVVSRYPNLDHLRYQILKFVLLFTITCGVIGVIYALWDKDMYKSYMITLPIIGVASSGLVFLKRLKLDVTAGIVFGLVYIGVYIPGYLGLMEPNIVILFLNSILVLAMFFVKYRPIVLLAYIVGVLANICIIYSTDWILHEYLLASFVFLILFYSISTLIYSFQERLESENKISQAKNKNINLLLKEIHFRVNNNLQTISSLLYLQSSYICDEEAKDAIIKGQQRVESMALIHKNLYHKDNHKSIEMNDYLSSLVANLRDAYSYDKNIKVNLDVESKDLDIDTAIPIGLIMNELITNAFKYAFPESSTGELDVLFEIHESSRFTLQVKDNGKGRKDYNEGFGSQLVTLLTKQLDATFSHGNENGYWCKITNRTTKKGF